MKCIKCCWEFTEDEVEFDSQDMVQCPLCRELQAFEGEE
jgi:predicted Zn-ribbon and HTH transcriptional regulator